MGVILILIIITIMVIGIVLANYIIETKIIINNLAGDIAILEREIKELKRRFDFEMRYKITILEEKIEGMERINFIKYRKDLFDDGGYNR